MNIFNVDVSLIISVIALFSSILVPIYLNRKSLNTPIQRESLKNFINIIDDEIIKHKKFYNKKDNLVDIHYVIYYCNGEDPNNAIIEFIDMLKDFKNTSEYHLLDKKYKKEIEKIIKEWSNYNSEDVKSPEIYVSKMEDIKKKFLNFLK